MHKIFTGLENAFAGPGWVWKPHKSKDQIVLHRNYIQKYFSTPKKNMFFSRFKKFSIFFSAKKNQKNVAPKNPKNFQDFSANIFRDFFPPKKSGKKSRKKHIFSELRFFSGYSFDVKIYDLSIYEVSRPIRARQTRFLAR